MHVHVDILEAGVLPNLRIALERYELKALSAGLTAVFDVELPGGRRTIELGDAVPAGESRNIRFQLEKAAFMAVARGETVVPLPRESYPFALIVTSAPEAPPSPPWALVKTLLVNEAPAAPAPVGSAAPADKVSSRREKAHDSPWPWLAAALLALVIGSFRDRSLMLIGAALLVYGLWKWSAARVRD
jgi:hypothetical protein